jgi:2-C-methyl-D-erythritol 2,4-cyclodiphosphate synthase
MRIGFGFDVHPLAEGRELWIGGVHIPSPIGAVGHSDADVLLHAICDAILGALALGDIGKHFPDTNNEFKGIQSIKLLAKVIELAHQQGYKVGNIDSALTLEKPKILPHIDKMRDTIANCCQIKIDQVSVKATTNEKMGYVGRLEGLNAYAVVLMVTE